MTLQIESIDYDKTKFVKCFVNRLFYREPHIHRSLEVMIVLNGGFDLVSHGQTYSFERGEMAIVNSLTAHEVKANTEEGSVLLCVQFSKSSLEILDIRNVSFDEIAIRKDSPDYYALAALMLSLGKCYFLKENYMYVNCLTLGSRLLYQLLTSVPNHSVGTPSEKDEVTDKRVGEICRYLDEHYTEKVSVKTLSDQMKLTPQYISKIFTQQMGISIRDYINKARFVHALRTIDSTDIPLIDVCYESGFSDYKYMEKCFKSILGCTPKEYRKRTGMIKERNDTKEFIFSDRQAAEYLERRFSELYKEDRLDDSLKRMYVEIFGESKRNLIDKSK